jgi:Rps23 Pro-64 3,4-dihydroxylase Tpa1-like proline 4-hydroxylase
LECPCSLIYLSPLPTDDDLAELYQRSTQFDAPEYVADERIEAILGYLTGRLSTMVEEISAPGRPLKLLEVGAGLAWMCRAAKRLDPSIETTAQDVSQECALECPWADRYLVGPVDVAELTDRGPFDVISLTHVFEHLPHPVAALHQLAGVLAPHGRIFVTMPYRPLRWDGTIETWKQYSYNHVPAHLQYFSSASLTLAARRSCLDLVYWDSNQDSGEALEAKLAHHTSPSPLNVVDARVRPSVDLHRRAFLEAQPFKHVMIDDFLDSQFAEALLRDFPQFDPDRAKNEFGEIGGKAVNEKLHTISPTYAALYRYLQTDDFLHLISEITAIPKLRADPNMFGGGTHENLHGQELDPHIDFNYDPPTKLHRRLNLLIYLNEGWRPEWGGEIELHSNPRRPAENQVKAFSPIFNRALLFETNEHSWHGFPKITLPPDDRHRSRKSISVYLYTSNRPDDECVPEHGTFYVQRPLPAHIRPGYTLTPEDIIAINELLARRDGWIEHYQTTELRVSAHSGELQARIQQLSSNQRTVGWLSRLWGRT